MPRLAQVFEHVENSQVVNKAYAFLSEVTLSSNPGKLIMYQEFVARIQNDLDALPENHEADPATIGELQYFLNEINGNINLAPEKKRHLSRICRTRKN